MKELATGFAYLRHQEYSQAYDYFCQKALEHKLNPKTLDTCLYGQAQALYSLGNVEFAKAILFAIINDGSAWEKPYIMLARVYEKEGILYQAQGDNEQAIAMFEKAHNVYLLGFERVAHSPNLYEHFTYFKEHFFPQANTFTPAFDDAKSLELLPSFLQREVGRSHLRRIT